MNTFAFIGIGIAVVMRLVYQFAILPKLEKKWDNELGN